jgi:putative redox protein
MTNQDALAREGVVTVRGLASGFAQVVETRTHRLIADEPLAVGGTDTGPTPYDLLLAALGS